MYVDKNLRETFLALIRLGIGHPVADTEMVFNWTALQSLAVSQGLAAVLLDGIEQLPDEQRPPKDLLLQWIGETLQSYEYRYELYRRAVAEMSSWYNSHGFRMMVLKGYACSLNWPKPEHRPCGDIDIWLFGKQKEADALLEKEKSIIIDHSHHHHTIFNWRGFTVENHYDFIEVHYRKSSSELEAILKEKGQDDNSFTSLYGEKVYVPSPNLHALFLTRHAIEHFASEVITLRQVLDWAFFVKAHGKDVDWEWLLCVLERFGMTPLFWIINAICVDNLGFDAALFPKGEVDTKMKERVLNEILFPEFHEKQPNDVIPRVLFKYRRWQANGWKHKLCYKESRWSTFWSGTWNHLLKPASI